MTNNISCHSNLAKLIAIASQYSSTQHRSHINRSCEEEGKGMDELLQKKPSSSHGRNIINRSTRLKGKSCSVLDNNDSSGNESDVDESRRPLELKWPFYQSGESMKRVALEGDEWKSRDMIADIFGESDNSGDDGDFEGFTENEVKGESVSDYAESHWSERLRLRLRHDSSKAGHRGDGSGRAVGAAAAAAVAAAAVAKDATEAEAAGQQETAKWSQGESNDSDSKEDQFESDFAKYLRRRKEENRGRRRGRKMSAEILCNAYEVISELVARMRAAAEEDRRLVANNQPATRKSAMLSEVKSVLIRADVQDALTEGSAILLSAITEWLSPVCGHTLPSLGIREALLRHLCDLHIDDTDLLEESGVGKAVMYLYKHPRETRANKQRAGYLISTLPWCGECTDEVVSGALNTDLLLSDEWSRAIFNAPRHFSSISKEERRSIGMRSTPTRRPFSR